MKPEQLRRLVAFLRNPDSDPKLIEGILRGASQVYRTITEGREAGMYQGPEAASEIAGLWALACELDGNAEEEERAIYLSQALLENPSLSLFLLETPGFAGRLQVFVESLRARPRWHEMGGA